MTRRCRGSGPAGPAYRYYRDAELGPAYTRAMDELFATYSAALPQVLAWAEDEFPRAEATTRRPPTPAR